MAPLRILIVDDHEVIRRSLRSLLSSRSEWEICGEAADGKTALEQIAVLCPDLVLMDVTMPVMSGTDAARAVRLLHPGVKTIIISQNDPQITRRVALDVGAVAFIAKSDLSRDLLSTIEKVAPRDAGLTVQDAARPQPKDVPAPQWLGSGGEMGELMRSKDWSQTPLGPMETWPQSLRVTASICVNSRFDYIVWWGPEFVVLYNDSYRRTLGRKHPEALGRPGSEVYREVWPIAGPMLEHVMATGEATWSADLLLLLERNGYPEETYHTFSYTPIRDDNGKVVGVITPVTETTDEVISRRRLLTLRELAARSIDANNEAEAWEFASSALSANPYDLPFAVLYRLNREMSSAEAVAFAGIVRGNEFLPDTLELSGEATIPRLIREVVHTGSPVEFSELETLGITLPGGFWGIPPRDLVLLPIAQTGQENAMGVLVAGVNRHKRLDEDYRGFLDLVARQIAKSVADVRVAEEERRRADSLAALDRAKTAFFSNISHELRTPLTLILGPLEDVRTRGPGAGASRDELELIHRNATRLLKLVNTLLEFSRIEAGRVQARFEPVALAEMTAEIASVFRSAIEKAGLEFDVCCDEPRRAMYVDPQLWEKIVLNLISNALKFTQTGEIAVTLQETETGVELRVKDSGAGIPAHEMPRLFERFHRIEGTHGRTNEGTGIGLALVQELVRLHGGTIRGESEIGVGSEFIVAIPAGSAHLPQDCVVERTAPVDINVSSRPFVEEAMAWFPPDLAEDQDSRATLLADLQPARLLLVEDNADMRQYVKRLLTAEGYIVDAVADGIAALERLQPPLPDLILSDVMLPRLDGIGLLRRLRQDPALEHVPIVLLSARAGEDFRIEGLEAGADEYLVKPFTARELLSRVRQQLEGSRRRRETQNRLKPTSSQLGTWDVNLKNGDAFWSLGLFTLLGYAPNECTPSREAWRRRVHPDDTEKVRQLLDSAIAERKEYRFDYRILLPNGQIRCVEIKGRFFFDNTGAVYRDLGAMREITAEKLSPWQDNPRASGQPSDQHRALQERLSEAVSQAELLDLVTDGAFICDTGHRITYWNRAAERLYGWTAAEAVGRDVSDLLQTEYPIPLSDLLATLEESGRWEGELLHTTRLGQRMPVYSRWIHKRGDRGEFTGWLEINADLTRQRQAEETARRLSGRILQLQDEERRKIARELHDSLGQYLAMLKITLDRYQRKSGQPSDRTLFDQCKEMVDQCIAETRTMSYLLHPPLLDENGLVSAVRWYVEGFAARSDIAVELATPTVIPRMLNEIETTLFRILQESLTNVHRHSQSKKVVIEIAHDVHSVSLKVRDFGKGISMTRIRLFRDRGTGMGVGLGGMRERVRELGGIFRIEPAQPSGTIISVEIPLIEGRKAGLPDIDPRNHAVGEAELAAHPAEIEDR